MTDTANAPEQLVVIWTIADEDTMPATVSAHTPKSRDFKHGAPRWMEGKRLEYVLATHCDELVAAAEEEAFARGANWAKEKARVEGRLVIVDSPELATLRADLAEAREKIARLTEALEFYADDNRTGLPSDGPWGLGSNDFGSRARAALQENANG